MSTEFSRSWGKEAEQLAVDHLIVEGYIIRDRNWRYKNHIEIDIVAQIDNTIVFVEVKARNEEGDNPVDAVDNKKMMKMVRGADKYLLQFDEIMDCRFDIISISGSPKNYKLEHIPAAFIPPLG